MNLNKKNLLFTLLLVVTLTSCEKDNTIISSKNVLIPLEIGNEWIYKDISKYRNPEKIDTTSLVIDSKIEINGSIGYNFHRKNNPFNAKSFIANNDEGDYVCIGGFSDVDTLLVNYVTYKYSAEVGDTWNCTSVFLLPSQGIFQKGTYDITCLATDTIIESAQMTFRCKLYESVPTSKAYTTRVFFCDNIGVIRSELYQSGKLQTIRELLEYHLQ